MAHAKHGKAACLDDLRRRILTQELEPGAYLDETQTGRGLRHLPPAIARGAAATGR
jgi:DNA-binding GntR family transcriptional regulator